MVRVQRSIGGKQYRCVSSPDWPRSRAEQRSGEGLSLKEGGVMAGTQLKGGANGGGHSCQVGRHYSGRQRWAEIFTDCHLHLLDREFVIIIYYTLPVKSSNPLLIVLININVEISAA